MNEQKEKLKRAWDDYEGFKNLKTILVVLFAYLVAVISNGFIEGFDYTLLFSFSVGLGTGGLLGAIQTVTAEGAARGNIDAEETDQDLRELKSKVRTEGNKVDRSVASETLKRYNIAQIATLRKETYERKVNTLKDDIRVLEARIDTLNGLSHWWQIPSRYVLRQLKRSVLKKKKTLSKLSVDKTYVKYQPLELDDIIFVDRDEGEQRTKKQRLQETPSKRTMRKMTKANLIKTLFFFGLQGAAYASFFGRRGLLWFLLLITFTIIATLLTAYVLTKRFATGDYKAILQEKIQDIEWLLEEQRSKKTTAQLLKDAGVVTFYPKQKED